jgi:hypothetical protein
MKNGSDRTASTLMGRLGRERWQIAALLVVQGIAATYLCWMKLVANVELVDGRKYVTPFHQVMATIDWAGAALGFLFLVVAVLLPPQRWVDDLIAWLDRRVRLVAVAVVVGLAAMSVTAHHAYPFTMDEYAPYFQSQVFARGRLTGQWPPQIAPLLVAPVNVGWFIALSKVTGQTCSEYWPGHAVLMTPFMFLGIPWACNPVLSGCGILLLAAAARRAYGEQAAGWAVLFALGSPVFAAYGISFYAMTSHFTLNLLYAWLLLSPTLPRVAGAGLVGGFALTLHNPFPHLVFALPWLGWLGLRSDRWTRLPLIGLCYAAVFLPIEVSWQGLRDQLHSVPSVAAVTQPEVVGTKLPQADVEGRPSSRPTIFQKLNSHLAVFSLPSAWGGIAGRIVAFIRLVAWDAPGLVVLACWGAFRSRRSTATRLFALSGLATFVGYVIVPASGGHGWGYRYFFSAWSCLPFLAAGLAADHPSRDSAEGADGSIRAAVPTDLLRAVGLAAVLSLACCLPVRLWQIHGFIADHLAQMPPKPTGLDLLQGDIVSFLDPLQGYFRNDLIRNHPFFETGPYVFVSQGSEQDKVVIQKLAEGIGLQARMTLADYRGSTWILQRAPQQEPSP